MKMRIWIFLLLLIFMPVIHADVVSAQTQKISNLRVEASVGFVGIEQPFLEGTGCGSRVWIDLKDVIGRAKYATAMLAFSTGKDVTIRANNTEAKVFGACKIYDILVRQ